MIVWKKDEIDIEVGRGPSAGRVNLQGGYQGGSLYYLQSVESQRILLLPKDFLFRLG